MQKITPHLWFDKEALAAAEFYTSIFENSKITTKAKIHDTPSGDCDIVGFQIMGFNFAAISAGPIFKINPSISFSLNLETKEEVQALWDKLSPGGQVLMELQKYPFSEFYGWLNDKFGVSWQLIALGENAHGRPKITPALMFTQDIAGKAEEAINFYKSIFENSKIGDIFRYPASPGPDKEGTIAHSTFLLEGQEFMALDSAQRHDFTFNEGVSLIINCKDQEEINHFWDKLSAVPECEQCGWVKDRFGVSWQIIPANMGELMSKNPAKTTPAMLKMKKIDIEALRKAGE